MSPIDNHDYHNFAADSAHPPYKSARLDSNMSLLEIYLRDMYLLSLQENSNDQESLTDTTTAASSTEFPMLHSRSEPILIPGATDPDGVGFKRRRARKERLSKTAPGTIGDFAALTRGATAAATARQAAFPVFEAATLDGRSNNRVSERGKSVFTVGSLVDRPPVPWPASFTSSHEASRRRRNLRHQQNDREKGSTQEAEDNIFLFEQELDNDYCASDLSF